jgi:hypothetical protein
MNRISRFAATVVVSGGLGLAGLGLGLGTAQAYSFHWCPGEEAPYTSGTINWDWNVCHSYHYQGNTMIDDADGRVISAPPPPPPGAVCGRDLFTGIPIPC